jgi:hypothetical protein
MADFKQLAAFARMGWTETKEQIDRAQGNPRWPLEDIQKRRVRLYGPDASIVATMEAIAALPAAQELIAAYWREKGLDDAGNSVGPA